MPNDQVPLNASSLVDLKGYAPSGYGNNLRFSGSDFLIFSERFKCVLGVYGLDNVLVDSHDDANNAEKKKKSVSIVG